MDLVCGACGRADGCACGAPFVEVASRPDGLFWALVDARVGCSSCSGQVPLGTINVDGSIRCARCGTALPNVSLLGALNAAHVVADLAWPDEEGRFEHATERVASVNPYRERREAWVTATHEQVPHDPRRVVRVAAGHPVCAACRRAFEVTTGHERGEATLRCPGCGTEEVVANPRAFANLHVAFRALRPGPDGTLWIAFSAASMLRFWFREVRVATEAERERRRSEAEERCRPWLRRSFAAASAVCLAGALAALATGHWFWGLEGLLLAVMCGLGWMRWRFG